MKSIYKFKLYQDKEIEKEVTKIDKDGKEFKVKEKVVEKSPRTFLIKKPNRNLYDEAEIFYATQVSELIKKGVLSAVQLNKRYLDDGGVLSLEQKKEYAEIYTEFVNKKAEYDKLCLTPEKDRTEKEISEISDLLNELVGLMNQIQSIEETKNTVLNNTAEILARDKTISWWMLHLSYEELEGEKFKAIFGDGDYEAKRKVYLEIDEREDDFEYEMVRKLLLITGLWYTGKAEKPEDFDVFIRVQDNQEMLESKEIIEKIEPEIKPVENPAT